VRQPITNKKLRNISSWHSKVRPQLGTVPDAQIASRYNVCREAVSAIRRRANIPPFRPQVPVKWAADILIQLGTVPDSQLADKLRCSISSIARQRRLRDIPPLFQGNQHLRKILKPHQARRLGKVADATLAQQTHVSIAAIAVLRRAAQIPSHYKQRQHSIPETILEQLGLHPDTTLAEMAQVSPLRIRHERRRRGIPPFQKRWAFEKIQHTLGKSTDAELAYQLGCTAPVVAAYRRSRGIAAVSGWSRQPKSA